VIYHRSERTAYRDLLGKSEGRRQIGGPRRRQEENIVTCINDYRWGLSWQLDLLDSFTYRA
jgi:hypothetical protein